MTFKNSFFSEVFCNKQKNYEKTKTSKDRKTLFLHAIVKKRFFCFFSLSFLNVRYNRVYFIEITQTAIIGCFFEKSQNLPTKSELSDNDEKIYGLSTVFFAACREKAIPIRMLVF